MVRRIVVGGRDGRGHLLGGCRAVRDRCIVGALHARGGLLHRVDVIVGDVSVAVPRRPGLPELPVGHTPPGGRVRVHLAEPEAQAHQPRSSSPRQSMAAPLRLLQADAHVRRGQDPERMSHLARSHRARLSLRHAAAADATRVVGVDTRAARDEEVRCRRDSRD